MTRGLLSTSVLAVAMALLLSACGGAVHEPEWPPLQKKWYDRAHASFRALDFEDADVAIKNALRVDGKREKVRLLAGQIALADLNYAEALALLKGLPGKDAQATRGRALWYAGRIDEAADELEQLLADPTVRDPWAQQVAALARRGTGRQPFRMSGGLLAVMEMPRVGNTALLVPVEIDGEPALGLISTSVAEVTIDSAGGREPSWVSLRFGGKVEVKDVPALSQDLSGISRQLNAPVKLLLGVNLLRHLNATVDFFGGQFVVRSFEPPPPPSATTVKLHYVRGGGMVLRGRFGVEEQSPAAALMIDTSMQYPLALDAAGWKKAGVDSASLTPIEGMKELRQGVVPRLQLGAYDIPGIPAVSGLELQKFESTLDIDLDGIVGSRLLAAFRITLTDQGRTLWLEDPPLPAVDTPPAATEPPAPPAAETVPAPAKGG